MRPLSLAALVLVALSCTPANADPGPKRGAPPGLTLAVALGDTARGFFSYTAGARATGALVTVKQVSFPASTWVGLPTDVVRPAAGAFAFVATNATADSADLTPCVIWTNASGQSPEVCGTSRRWRRPPGTGTVGWDSLKVSVRPDTATVWLGAGRTLCGFKQFLPSGRIAVRTADRPSCDSIAARFFTPAQLAVTAAEQAHADSACYTWASSAPLKAPVTAAACAGVARIDGLDLTWAPDALREFRPRYAAARILSGPVITVTATGLLTCQRPGQAWVHATVEGVRTSRLVTCAGAALPLQLAGR